MNSKISSNVTTGVKPVKVRSLPQEKRSSPPTPRRLSRQGSTSSNNEVYFGDSSVSVPFRWESRPGTPKVNFGDRRPLPPLTPPPSYLSSRLARKSINKKHRAEAAEIYNSGGILHSVLPKLNLIKKSHHSSPSLSSSSSSSSSSVRSSPCTPDSYGRPVGRKLLAQHFRNQDDEENGENEEVEAHLGSIRFGTKRGCSANLIKLLLRQRS